MHHSRHLLTTYNEDGDPCLVPLELAPQRSQASLLLFVPRWETRRSSTDDQLQQNQLQAFPWLLPWVALMCFCLLLVLQLPCTKSFHGSEAINIRRPHLLPLAPGCAALHDLVRGSLRAAEPCHCTSLASLRTHNSFAFPVCLTSS